MKSLTHTTAGKKIIYFRLRIHGEQCYRRKPHIRIHVDNIYVLVIYRQNGSPNLSILLSAGRAKKYDKVDLYVVDILIICT